jgi:hypothetical protein
MISGRENIVVALVRSHPDSQRMYLHGAGLKERLRQPRVSAADAEASGRSSSTAGEGAWIKIRADALNFKSDNVSKVVDENGKPLVVYHGQAATSLNSVKA